MNDLLRAVSVPNSVRVTARVASIERIAEDVVSVELEAAAGTSLPVWLPGDHIDIELAPGLTRQYSLCGAAWEAVWRIAVRRDPTGGRGSRYVHETLSVGDEVRVQGPKHHFPLDEHGEAPVLIAGGIGVTPILTMAEHLHAAGQAFTFVYVGRGARRLVFAERVRAVGGRVVDRDLEPGFALRELLREGAHVYVCGPQRMLDEVAAHVPPALLHTEDFARALVAPTTQDEGADGTFEIQLGYDGPVHVVPRGCSLLDVLLQNGVDVMWSCREGNCASCETNVLEGEVDHRDVILDDEERAANDVMFPCVSRARSARLVLDL